MRVQLTRKGGLITVIETVQIIRWDSGSLIFILPYSQYGEIRKYHFYKSIRTVDDTEYNRWCEQLLRTGYLDLTRVDLEFISQFTTV